MHSLYLNRFMEDLASNLGPNLLCQIFHKNGSLRAISGLIRPYKKPVFGQPAAILKHLEHLAV